MFPTICRCCGATIEDRAPDNVNLCSECRAGQSEESTGEGSVTVDSFPVISLSVLEWTRALKDTLDVPTEDVPVQEAPTASKPRPQIHGNISGHGGRPSGPNLPRPRRPIHTAFY